MPADLAIILPLRNPPPEFLQTVDSLVAQDDRGFMVLLSDNYSRTGEELIATAEARLAGAGIPTRRVRPPFELGRVEHWNWAHFEADAEWLKPLFAGDWLAPDYVRRWRAGVAAHPTCRYVFVNFVLHRGSAEPVTVTSPWSGGFHSAEVMGRRILTHGMQFGPPSAAAFAREAFVLAGGYPTALPICADSELFCRLAARFGVLGLAEPLCHFNIHGARFSTSLPGKQREAYEENLTYSLRLACQAWSERRPIPYLGFARLLLREWRQFRRQPRAAATPAAPQGPNTSR